MAMNQPMATQTLLRDEINSQIIEALKSNTIVPWQQPWTDDRSCVMPASILTKLPYRDINPILLRIAAAKNSYTSRWWGTERQWTVMGGKLKPGVKSVRVFENTDGPDVIGVFVYNMDCVEGGRFGKLHEKPDVSLLAEATDDEGNPRWRMEAGRGLVNIEAERIIKATGADFREEPRNGALYYRPPLDYIVVPLMSQFYFGPGGPASYYATAFHELTHWTETRLYWYADPKLSVKKRYALGELRSDISSAYVSAALGIPPQKGELNFDRRTNFSKYVKHWVGMMEEDNSVIFRITRAASEAADFILSFAGRRKAEGQDDLLNPTKTAIPRPAGSGYLA
jgi:antirestriction protein ArdC